MQTSASTYRMEAHASLPSQPQTHKLLLEAKIIQSVMKVSSIANDCIRKSAVSPNQAFLIAQRKDNQSQTMRPSVTSSSSSVHPEPLPHIPLRAAWQRKAPALTLQVLSDNNLTWQPGGMRNKPTIWSQVFQFGEIRSDSSLHQAALVSFLPPPPPLPPPPSLTYVHT
ncbi:uncharacterized protein V6R79_005443 [Siganus canaliculatus]